MVRIRITGDFQIVRKCIRCDSVMIEGCGIMVKGAPYGIVLSDNKKKWWSRRTGEPRAAICPNCGEVSIYLEDADKLKMIEHRHKGSVKANWE